MPDIVTSNRVIVFALFTGVVDLVNEIYSGSHEQWHIKGFKRLATGGKTFLAEISTSNRVAEALVISLMEDPPPLGFSRASRAPFSRCR